MNGCFKFGTRGMKPKCGGCKEGGREEKPIRVNNQKARGYPEGGNLVNPKSPPLQGMKAQPLQSLFVGDVKNAV